MWIAGAERSRQIDRVATTDFGVPAMVLMERAGLAVFDAMRELLPHSGRVTVLCGKGNNGGDGLVVARHALEQGYHVEVLIAASEPDLSLDASMQLATARAQGVRPIFYDDARWHRKAECLGSRDLLIDALLGTGIQGEVHGPVLEAIRAINRSGVPTLSVDVPSGVHTDTGEELSESVWALRTVTFGLPKPFLFQGIGLEHSGYWTVADIGFPSSLLEESTEARLIDREWVSNLLPERLRDSHKGANGRVLIVAGSRHMPGAAILAARAAIRTGAGLVTVAAVPSVCDAVAAQLPEVIIAPLAEKNGALAPEAAEQLLEHQERFDSALFGPGLTHGEGVLSMLEAAWSGWDLPSCIDADALNAVSIGVPLPASECVLTPHPGEMSRLLKESIAEVQADRFATVRECVERFGKCALLKGPYSIVGDRSQPHMVNRTGNPGMAAAGMGDVLAGMIGTMLAQDLPPYCAASCGMYWHGLAGDLCSADIGAVGYRASEVADALPKARAKITGTCSANSPD